MTVKPRRAEVFIFISAFALAAFYNFSFWQKIIAIIQPDSIKSYAFIVALFIFVAAFFGLVFSLLSFKYITRPLLTLIVPTAALATYFMSQYGISIDAKMVQNVLETDFKESLDLLTLKLVIYFLVLGVLPVFLLWKTPLIKTPIKTTLKNRAILLGAASMALILVAGVFYQSFAPLLRNNRDIKYYLVPNNFMAGLYNNFKVAAAPKGPVQKIGLDAKKGTSWTRATRKKLVVLVIGETARAANFSLNGYAKNTNPRLAAMPDIVNFSQAYSCGTATAASVPCIFSGMGHQHYDAKKAAQQEGLLDVVQRAGISVTWIDNQSGCYRTCTRVNFIATGDKKMPEFCDGKECHDGILVKKLADYAAAMSNDSLIVMHQMGSHGPAYYQRYPVPAFEKFTPVCKTSQIDQCTQQQIINGYDNTILYTDTVLANVIETLKTLSAQYDTAFIYMSDHGESLGEYNLYLHGAPYAFAPDFQKHIPAVAWVSAGMAQSENIRTGCLQQKKNSAVSHDNIFHSVLGLFDISTSLYQRPLDLLGDCRG